MAKIAFTKLGLSKNQEVKNLNWNEQNIEVKQYLPISEVLDIVASIVNKAHDGESNFSNPIKVDIYTTLEILFNYTNINFTDKQKEDVLKLYDLAISSGLYAEVVKLIPEEEYCRLVSAINDTITAVYAYQNSVMGVLDNVIQDYGNLDMDASNIYQNLADPKNMEFLKSVLTKLG